MAHNFPNDVLDHLNDSDLFFITSTFDLNELLRIAQLKPRLMDVVQFICYTSKLVTIPKLEPDQYLLLSDLETILEFCGTKAETVNFNNNNLAIECELQLFNMIREYCPVLKNLIGVRVHTMPRGKLPDDLETIDINVLSLSDCNANKAFHRNYNTIKKLKLYHMEKAHGYFLKYFTNLEVIFFSMADDLDDDCIVQMIKNNPKIRKMKIIGNRAIDTKKIEVAVSEHLKNVQKISLVVLEHKNREEFIQPKKKDKKICFKCAKLQKDRMFLSIFPTFDSQPKKIKHDEDCCC